jgi:hypothetical protein
MPITIDGNGTITGASTLATAIASPTFTTPNINSAQFATVSGTAPIYACRAWVNFNGTSTVAIRASGNVTSITDNGTGDYTVNFTTAMPDINYSFLATGAGIIWGGPYNSPSVVGNNNADFATTNVRLRASNSGNASVDQGYISAAIFR